MNVIEIGQGRPIVLIHGFGVDHHIMLALEPAFERAGGWRRIYLDLPWTKASNAEATSAQDVVDQVHQKIRDLLPQEPFAVVGGSFGGMVARHVAHEFGDQVLGLALIVPVFVSDRAQRNNPPRTVLRYDADVVAGLGEAAGPYTDYAVVHSETNARDFVTYSLPGLSAAKQEVLDAVAANYVPEFEPELVGSKPFAQPTLIVTGRQDETVGYRDSWTHLDHYPRATFVVLDSAGHNAHLDQPQLTHALVEEWLERVERELT